MTKKDKIIKLIRLTNFHPEQMDPMLASWIEAALMEHKQECDMAELFRSVKSEILKDHFLDQFVPYFDKIFTEKELDRLIEVYQSEPVKKFFKMGKGLTLPLYQAISQVIRTHLSNMIPEKV